MVFEYLVKKENEKGNYHCEDGPAIVRKGLESWYFDGLLHRVDGGPAFITPRHMSWFQHGIRTRSDGPAEIWNDMQCKYWINGCPLNFQEFREHFIIVHLKEYKPVDELCSYEQLKLQYQSPRVQDV